MASALWLREREAGHATWRSSSRLSSMRKLCELKRMAIFRDLRVALMPLPGRSGRESGQSLAEYGLILALVAAAAIAVLGMVSPAVFGRLDSVTAALGGEPSTVGVPPLPPAWVAVGLLVVGAVGVYLVRTRRG